MSFITTTLNAQRPASILPVALPNRIPYYPSPPDWRNEVLYFLLPDRFSDNKEDTRPLYDRNNATGFRRHDFQWDKWSESGGNRFQGGTLQGIISKLDYIKDLGATAIWIGPVFKQRVNIDTYHGYAIQDFLDVDSRFGTRNDLVDLVQQAHAKGMRIVLDVVFNHSGHNWNYQNNEQGPAYLNWPAYHEFGNWLSGTETPDTTALQADDGVWPTELQATGAYTRAGMGSLADNDIDNPNAESKRSDFPGFFRDFNFDGNSILNDLIRCYKYWIALTDCDGFRVDTLKHVPEESASIFCNAIKEYAASLGKTNFFIVGEVAGGDANAQRYAKVIGTNLSATLDIGDSRSILHNVAKGIQQPSDYFDLIKEWPSELGSHRNSGLRHVIILDDHDQVCGTKWRFTTDAPIVHQLIVGVAIQFFSLGIPCIYYGTEQAFAGPEESERKWLPYFNQSTGADWYLRETMFGADHPLLSGIDGTKGHEDNGLPGFGAFGSVGAHFFDKNFEVYRRIAALAAVRAQFPVLRFGRLYQREISNFSAPFDLPASGELIAWSRILDEEECLCIANGNGNAERGGDVIVDAALNSGNDAFFEVIVNTAETAQGAGYQGSHPSGEKLPVQTRDGAKYISIRNLGPAEVLVLNNRP